MYKLSGFFSTNCSRARDRFALDGKSPLEVMQVICDQQPQTPGHRPLRVRPGSSQSRVAGRLNRGLDTRLKAERPLTAAKLRSMVLQDPGR